ncbi:ribosomal protein S18-alanine N-acetyltransferase, partial [Chloroflexota bacterium]
PPNYHHELRNRLARYTVACDREKYIEPVEREVPPEKTGLLAGLKRLLGRIRFSGNGLSESTGHFITGFVGCWVLADEAHVTSIAVREAYRRHGIGELLLINAIDMAIEMKATIVTLEVRVSNTVAQKLYTKYGFTEAGVRKGYYTDNREDAIIMSTANIASSSFKTRFRELKQAHSRKWETDLHKIAR